jgi:hypothetical protein
MEEKLSMLTVEDLRLLTQKKFISPYSNKNKTFLVALLSRHSKLIENDVEVLVQQRHGKREENKQKRLKTLLIKNWYNILKEGEEVLVKYFEEKQWEMGGDGEYSPTFNIWHLKGVVHKKENEIIQVRLECLPDWKEKYFLLSFKFEPTSNYWWKIACWLVQ